MPIAENGGKIEITPFELKRTGKANGWPPPKSQQNGKISASQLHGQQQCARNNSSQSVVAA
jgi:hypothetical protein